MSKLTDHQVETIADFGSIIALASVVLVFLKAMGFIDWSWWAVLVPFYIGPLLAAAMVTCVLMACTIVYFIIFIVDLLERKF